jgi:hypothetical protein
MIYYAAGVLIMSWYKDELYVLLGKDHYETYSDFGGKCDSADMNNQQNTASREMYEETCGCIFDVTEIKHIIKGAPIINTRSYTDKPYYMYVIFIPYDEKHSENFEKVFSYISKLPKMIKFLEKTSIKWIKFEDVVYKNVKLRNIFQKTIEIHKNNILKIAYNYLTTNKSYNNGKP